MNPALAMPQWKVKREEEGERLVNLLQKRLGPTWSKRRIKTLLDQRGCVIDGTIHRHASYKVSAGQILTFSTVLEKSSKEWWKERTLYEDEQIVVLNKPPGITCDAEETLEGLRSRWSDCVLVHRLDRDTSGVWLLARGENTQKKIEDLFRLREVQKHYLAIVDGAPKEKEGVISLPILRMAGEGGQNRWQVSPKGRPAETVWKKEKQGKGMALLSCYPKTGRTHQIRLHCKALGHPIVGDYRYTRRFSCALHPERHLLHAYTLSFVHPSIGKQLSFTAPIPQDLQQQITDMERR